MPVPDLARYPQARSFLLGPCEETVTAVHQPHTAKSARTLSSASAAKRNQQHGIHNNDKSKLTTLQTGSHAPGVARTQTR